MHQICTQAHLIYKNQGFRESDARLWGLINIGMKKLETREEKEERRKKKEERRKKKEDVIQTTS
ncbi:hypothetical protein AB4538_11100 [Vibrio lentus]